MWSHLMFMRTVSINDRATSVACAGTARNDVRVSVTRVLDRTHSAAQCRRFQSSNLRLSLNSLKIAIAY